MKLYLYAVVHIHGKDGVATHTSLCSFWCTAAQARKHCQTHPHTEPDLLGTQYLRVPLWGFPWWAIIFGFAFLIGSVLAL